jgi:holliday junction DNA helicase RuvA
VIEASGRRLSYVSSGCVRSGEGELAARLKTLLEGLNEVIAQHVPAQVVVEKVFVNVNPQSTLALGQARGTAICAAVLAGLPVAEYTALQVKQSVVGAGNGAPAARASRRALTGCRGRARLRHLPCARRQAGHAGNPRPAHEERSAGVIGRLTGRLAAKHPPQVLVDVGGIAYEVDVPMSTFYSLPATGEAVTLFTHLVVREDAHLLFGFATLDERTAFRRLIRISGIGARTALSVLSGLSVGDLADAVARQEAGRLVKVPGIGKKTAERLLLELKGKLEEVSSPSSQAPSSDVLNALLALGYSEKEAQAVVRDLPGGLPVAEAIRAALKALAKR